MSRITIIPLALSLFASPAMASGGLSCTADDGKVGFDIQAGVTRGMGGPVFSLAGELTIKGGDVAADLAKTKFERDNLAQYWLDGEELRLLLYKERAEGEFGSVELTVRTKALGEEDEGSYAGDYALQVFESTGEGSGDSRTTDFAGKVECTAE